MLKPRGTSGFTIIELMIVLAILSVLVAIAVPGYQGYQDRKDIASAVSDIVLIQVAVEQYFANKGGYPPDLATIGADKNDPWGNPYKYLNMALTVDNGQKRKDQNLVPINSDYDLYSMGPDGQSVSPLTAQSSRDDIVRANNGAFLGVAEDY